MSQRPMDDAYSTFVCNDNKTGWAARDFFDAGWQAALSQSEPAQVSQPVAETYVINKGGSGEFIAIDWKDKEGSHVGLLYSSPPDYEAMKLRVAELEKEIVNHVEDYQILSKGSSDESAEDTLKKQLGL